jgi:hypothetical protein
MTPRENLKVKSSKLLGLTQQTPLTKPPTNYNQQGSARFVPITLTLKTKSDLTLQEKVLTKIKRITGLNLKYRQNQSLTP